VVIGCWFLIISFLLTYGRENFNKNKPVLPEQRKTLQLAAGFFVKLNDKSLEKMV